jgi:hypothetical protein
MDVFLTIVSALINLAVAALGVLMGAKPPQTKEERRRYILAFVVIGVLGFCVVIWQAIRAGKAQTEAAAAQEGLRTELLQTKEAAERSEQRLTEVKNQLDAIQKDALQPGSPSDRLASAIEGIGTLLGERNQTPSSARNKSPQASLQPKSNASQPPTETRSNAAVIDKLSDFIEQGRSIQSKFIETNDPNLITNQHAKWNNEVDSYLEKNLGRSYAVQFRSVQGGAERPINRNFVGGGVWALVKAKVAVLSGFISELRR